MDYSPSIAHQFPVHGIFQARILEWVTIFLLQGIFATQESNLRLLCHHITSRFFTPWAIVVSSEASKRTQMKWKSPLPSSVTNSIKRNLFSVTLERKGLTACPLPWRLIRRNEGRTQFKPGRRNTNSGSQQPLTLCPITRKEKSAFLYSWNSYTLCKKNLFWPS